MSIVSLTSKDLISKPLQTTHISFGEARQIFSMLTELGVMNKVMAQYDDETGNMWFLKKSYYRTSLIPEQNEVNDGWKESDKLYSMRDFIKLIVRLDKIKYAKVKNAEQRINDMHNAVTKLKGMINE